MADAQPDLRPKDHKPEPLQVIQRLKGGVENSSAMISCEVLHKW